LANSRRYLPTLVLLVVLAFGAVFPGLYFAQVMVRGVKDEPSSLVIDVEDRLVGQDPYRLLAILVPVEETSSKGTSGDRDLHLRGSGRLLVPVYPWKESPFVGDLGLDLPARAIAGRPTPFILSTRSEGFVAWYQERYVGGSGEASARVPCAGSLHVENLSVHDEASEPLRIGRFDGIVDLLCSSFGRDLRWGSDDDLVWKLSGGIEARYGKD
jgi:hypothetical protein